MKVLSSLHKILILIFAVVISSCNLEQQEQFSLRSPLQVKKTPCTVENMALAYENLIANPTAGKYFGDNAGLQKSGVDYVVSTTHKYYRFLPSDSIEYEALVSDTILAVSDTPFEYASDDGGVNYVDPNLAGEGHLYTYYYSVVPIDYILPSGIESEWLADLHFTPENEIGENPTEEELNELDFYYDLNLQALKQSGNLEEEEKQELSYLDKDDPNPLESKPYDVVMREGIPFDKVIIDFSDIEVAKKRRSWRPSGRITVEEDGLTLRGRSNNIVGVRNATVKIRKWGWLVIRRAETFKSGTFVAESTRTKRVKYAVYFQPRDKRFIVKAGTVFWDARHRGTNTYSRKPWNQHFSLNGSAHRSHFYALIHNAAADYTFDWVRNWGFNLARPWWGIRLSAKFNGTSSNYSGFFGHPTWGIGGFTGAFVSEVRISRYDGDNDNKRYKGSIGIYATTTHELAHAGHFSMDGLIFAGVGGIVDRKQRLLLIESWAEGVETIVTNKRYDDIDPGSNLQYNSFRQELFVGSQDISGTISEYTPLFIDLNDNLNQNAVFSSFTPRPPIDRVSGYTIPEMQESLISSRTLVQLENRLRNMHSNPTEGNLVELFAYPQAVLETIR